MKSSGFIFSGLKIGSILSFESILRVFFLSYFVIKLFIIVFLFELKEILRKVDKFFIFFCEKLTFFGEKYSNEDLIFGGGQKSISFNFKTSFTLKK